MRYHCTYLLTHICGVGIRIKSREDVAARRRGYFGGDVCTILQHLQVRGGRLLANFWTDGSTMVRGCESETEGERNMEGEGRGWRRKRKKNREMDIHVVGNEKMLEDIGAEEM